MRFPLSVALLSVFLAPASPAPALSAPPPGYRVEDLQQRLGHPGVVYVPALNNAGDLGGQLVVSGDNGENWWHPFAYADGVLKDLGDVDVGEEVEDGWVAKLNDAGHFVGSYEPFDHNRYYPFVYHDGAIDAFFVQRGQAGHAVDVNQRGDVLGNFYDIYNDEMKTPFLYAGGRLTLLDSLAPPGGSAEVKAFNERGQIVGTVRDAGDPFSRRAFIYERGTVTYLGTPPGAAVGVVDINEAGQVLGAYQESADRWPSFVYEGGAINLLSVPASYYNVADINEAGHIVGALPMPTAESPSLFHAFLYADGSTYDLNDFIDADSGVRIEYAWAINDLGQITAYARRGNEYIPILLTPIPEPGSSTTVLGAWMFWALQHRSRRSVFER